MKYSLSGEDGFGENVKPENRNDLSKILPEIGIGYVIIEKQNIDS
jgi:hypothetical protein